MEATTDRSGWSAVGNRAGGRAARQGSRPSGVGPSLGELGHRADPYVRAVLQSALGRDVGDVRVRSGPAEEQLLDTRGVDALTDGRTVAIRPEHDRPQTLGGRALLLHELTHVLQQSDADRRDGGRTTGPAVASVMEEQARDLSVGLAARPPIPPRPVVGRARPS